MFRKTAPLGNILNLDGFVDKNYDLLIKGIDTIYPEVQPRRNGEEKVLRCIAENAKILINGKYSIVNQNKVIEIAFLRWRTKPSVRINVNYVHGKVSDVMVVLPRGYQSSDQLYLAEIEYDKQLAKKAS